MLPLLASALSFAQDPSEPMDRYVALRLEVVEAEVNTVYAPGYDRSGRFWFVVDGQGAQLDAVDLALRLGDDPLAQQIRHQRRAQMGGAAALGGATVGLAVLAMYRPPNLTPICLPASALTAVAGTLLARTSIRRYHPSAAYSEAQARQEVDGYNASLRDRLFADP